MNGLFFFGSGIWPFIQINLNSVHPKMLCTKFGWNWPSSSGEDKNVKNLQTDGWITGDQRSSLEILAQVSQKKNYISHKNENRAIPDYILFNKQEDFLKLCTRIYVLYHYMLLINTDHIIFRAVTSLFGTGSMGPMIRKNYRHFGKLRKIAHLSNVEHNWYFF